MLLLVGLRQNLVVQAAAVTRRRPPVLLELLIKVVLVVMLLVVMLAVVVVVRMWRVQMEQRTTAVQVEQELPRVSQAHL
jgi:flagellar basal body-associated protein FliL